MIRQVGPEIDTGREPRVSGAFSLSGLTGARCATVAGLDQVRFEVDCKPVGVRSDANDRPMPYGGGADVVPFVNGRDLREVVAEGDEAATRAHAEGMVRGRWGRTFPRLAYYGDSGYAVSPFDSRVMLLMGALSNVELDVNARIEVGDVHVRWSDFDNPHVSGWPWRTFDLPTYVFDRAQYIEAVEEAGRVFARDANDPPGWEESQREHAIEERARHRERIDAVMIALARKDEVPPIGKDDLTRLLQPGGGFKEVRSQIADRLGMTTMQAHAVVFGCIDDLTSDDIERLRIQRWELASEIARLADGESVGTIKRNP